MDQSQINKIYKEAIDQWGVKAQLRMIVEESLELLEVLHDLPSYFNALNGRNDKQDAITEEIVDLTIMLEQFVLHLNLDVDKKAKRGSEKTLFQLGKFICHLNRGRKTVPGKDLPQFQTLVSQSLSFMEHLVDRYLLQNLYEAKRIEKLRRLEMKVRIEKEQINDVYEKIDKKITHETPVCPKCGHLKTPDLISLNEIVYKCFRCNPPPVVGIVDETTNPPKIELLNADFPGSVSPVEFDVDYDDPKEMEALLKLSEECLMKFFENEPDLYSEDDLKVKYEERDPTRIERITQSLNRFWADHPHQRLGQLLLNYVFGTKPPFTHYIWNMEDELIEKRLNKGGERICLKDRAYYYEMGKLSNTDIRLLYNWLKDDYNYSLHPKRREILHKLKTIVNVSGEE